MERIDYPTFVQKLLKQHSHPDAMSLAVGGEYEGMGVLQRELLISCGLMPNHFLIDVGCGSGRLARQLTGYLQGKYLGIDVVPELLDHARAVCKRPDWRFEQAKGFSLFAEDSSADMVCFFSLLTHLRFEESFTYLRDAKRVLKPGGKVVLTFLEFAIPSHWTVFENDVANLNAEVPVNQFLSRDALHAWAYRLGFTVEVIHGGDKPHIPLREPVKLSSGTVFESQGTMGQSTCVLVANA
jgi:ubiquinone/menaquinone biosynthesis C-methylase UbiE